MRPKTHTPYKKNNIMKKYIGFLLSGLLLFSMPVLGASAKGVGDSGGTIRIEADNMISREGSNSVLFTGNVDARQDKTTIKCEEMTVFYHESKSKKKGKGKVKKLHCKDNVEVTNGDWLGISNIMNYYSAEKKMILSGNAKAWQGKNMVSGETIIHYMESGKTEVRKGKKGSGRIKMTLPGS